MSRKAFKVWNCSRIIKTACCCEIDLNTLIKKANDFGIPGNKLVLEEDGTEIRDTEGLECFADKVLILLDDDCEWSPAQNPLGVASPLTNTIESGLIFSPTQPALNLAPNSIETSLYQENQSSFTAPAEFTLLPESVDHQNNSQNYRMVYVKSPTNPIASTSADAYVNVPKNSEYTSYASDDTLSMSSGVISSTSSSSNMGFIQSKILFSNYKINWEKMPNHIANLFEKGEPIGNYLQDFIHFVIDDMRSLSFYIPVPIFRQVAQDALSKFPKSLGMVSENGDINTEPVSMTAKLVYHNNYLNRKGIKRNSSTAAKPSTIKKLKSLKESCPNWLSESDEEYDSLEQKRIFLKENASVSNLKPHEFEVIENYFLETFSIQRIFLNDIEYPPTITEIQQKWPHLLIPRFAKKHFCKLINNRAANITNIENKIDAIISYSKKNKRANLDKISDDQINKQYAMLLILTTYFSEDISFIFKNFSMGTKIEDVDPIHNSPWAAALEIDPENTIYYIFVEKINCATAKTLLEALEILLIFFFNFNMSYPKEISLTMQTLQNLIGVPNTFGRSRKKTLGNQSKVRNLLDAINKNPK